VAFVVARLSSSRLPAKQLRPVGGKPIIDWIFQNLSQCRELDEVVLATVAEPQNEPLRGVARRAGVSFFWYEGEVNDVTTRLRRAAETHDADICILVSADCPLVHGQSVDELIKVLRAAPQIDYLTLPPLSPERHCLLEGIQIARRSAWQRADDLSDRPELREHQFPVIYRNPGLFNDRPTVLSFPVYGPRHRMSVDTWADMDFMNAIHDRLAELGRPFSLPEAVKLLDEEPHLRTLNAHVYQRGLVEEIREVLLVADAGGEFGYGHFMRSREVAGQIVESLSWPVTFLLDDEKAAGMAEDCGFKVLWGALERPVRPAPKNRACVTPSEAAQGLGLVLVDVSARRTPAPGWRKRNFPDIPVVVMDREDNPAREADLIIFPGVTGRAKSHRTEGPRIVEGMEYAILRREVSRHIGVPRAKDIDVLAYLYDEGQKTAVAQAAAQNGWRAEILQGFNPEFPKLLARSKVFLSGFGQSFYEALALGTYPAAWPLSPLHEADAEAFYQTAGLPPVLVRTAADLNKTLGPLLAESPDHPLCLSDGTPAILREIAALCRDWPRKMPQ
jgi:spore coat polysaccharide biosynthesis protein SpsF